MIKKQIIQAIREFAKKHGRNPSMRDLILKKRVTHYFVYHCFGSWPKALAEAGLEAHGPGFAESDTVLLLDWARVARKLKKLPSAIQYEQTGRYSSVPFHTRYQHWKAVPEAFAVYMRRAGKEREWQDVLAMIAERKEKEARGWRKTGRRSQKEWVMRDRPIYGSPLGLPELANEPVNEAGVIFAFGMVARKLGFCVQRLQYAYPDGEALREVARGQWQKVRIEFEFASKNFLKHGHNRRKCDVIVCWLHDWPECPKGIEVVELRKVVRGLVR
jgi:hypothetical protein